MKIATWNVNSLKVRLPHVLDWLDRAQPDVLAVQETKSTDDNFPAQALQDAGYHVTYMGEKAYNGVALISAEPARDVLLGIPELAPGGKRILAATFGNVRLLNLYVVNGQAVGSEKYAYKLHWLERIIEFVSEELPRYDYYAVVGDFNIAPTDDDVYHAQRWHESILCSSPERERLNELFSLGFVDTFRKFSQADRSFSWWDYRHRSFAQNHGLRLDLILANKALAAACTACTIDPKPRALERPSDHAPVIADFSIANFTSMPT
jgi:exodeoxyribonuclease-3